MRTSRLVVALLIACGLVAFALQNMSPSLALVFLGFRSLALPLGVWLSGAIALGVLTTLALFSLMGLGPIAPERPRRRWTVRPDPPMDAGSRTRRPQPPSGQRPTESQRRPQSPNPRPDTGFTGQNPARSTPRSEDAVEDWQTWGQRIPASQWEDWQQAEDDPATAQFSRRQRQDRRQAETTINDMAEGWDSTAQETVYVAPGGSDVEDTLDDIEEGWDDWESEAASPAETAYAQQYRGRERVVRTDSIYAPPDDVREGYQEWAASSPDDDEDWGLDDDDETPSPTAADQERDAVYDAEYRVIIPPHRPLHEDGENDRDRTP